MKHTHTRTPIVLICITVMTHEVCAESRGTGILGIREPANADVHDNITEIRLGNPGLRVGDTVPNPTYWCGADATGTRYRGIRFHANTWYLARTGNPFFFGSSTIAGCPGSASVTTWQNTLGLDTDGMIVQNADAGVGMRIPTTTPYFQPFASGPR